MRTSKVLVVLVCFSLMASANSTMARPRKVDQPPTAAEMAHQEKNFPLGATWTLASVNGKPVSGDVPSFNLDQQLRATGFAGCNTFSMALYPSKGQKLAGGPIALTHKTCDKSAMQLERTFLVSLHSLPSWDVTPVGDLTLKGASGLLLFRRGI